jgi:hypothetical protein
MTKYLMAALLAVAASGCATMPSVHPEDQAAWVGVPVSALDAHPVFMTLPVVKSVAADGTEIRNYVNGGNVSACAGGGLALSPTLTAANASCMQRQAACNNIFYIKNGVVTAYTPIGSGGARCYTDYRDRPGFAGSTDFN